MRLKSLLKKIVFGICLWVVQVQAQTTLTYTFTGSMQSFTVPSNVCNITVTSFGAQGANGGIGADGSSGGVGGLGSSVTGVIPVTPNDVINIFVGGSATGRLGGYNGGGNGGVNTFGGITNLNFAGGGGGASDIRINGTILSDRVLIAAGGGGGGNGGNFNGAGTGGLSFGGSFSGTGGFSQGGNNGGVGAIGTIGGLFGNGCPLASGTSGGNGVAGVGGNGGNSFAGLSATGSGGGGGGGATGGGGGGGASAGSSMCAFNGSGGGGGGSRGTNATIPTATNTSTGNNVWAGNGQVVISYAVNPPLGIATQPVSSTIIGGSFAAINVSATGTALTYLWSNGATTSGFNTTVAGAYQVTVTGQCGTAISNTANVNIMNESSLFVTLWNMSIAGSGANQLSFGVGTSGVAQYYWETSPLASLTGFGTFNGSNLSITGLPANAIIKLKIAPQNFNSVSVNYTILDYLRIQEVQQWGTSVWNTFNQSFANASNLKITASDIPNLSSLNNLRSMFLACASIVTIPNLNMWNTSNVIDMSFMFADCVNFNDDFSNWNISNVLSFNYMLNNTLKFNKNLSGLSNKFNANVILTNFLNYSGMSPTNYDAFLTSLNATTLTGRTLGATGLRYCTSSAARANLVLSTVSGGKGWTITDNGPIGTPTFGFGTSLGINIGDAVPALSTISGNGMVGTWTPSIINNSISGVYTFSGACGNTTLSVSVLQPSDYFVTLWNMSIAGSGTNQLSFDVGTSGVAQYYWETVPVASVTGFGTYTGFTLNISGLPANAMIKLKIAPQNINRIFLSNSADRNRIVDVSLWGTANWQNFSAAFEGCSNLQISAADVPNLSGVSDLSFMFSGCSQLNSPTNINSWNTSNITLMNGMFANCTNFNQNISSWNISSVTSMGSMFQGASAFNQNISSWNVGNVTNFDRTFTSASSFNQNISNWNVSNGVNFNDILNFASSFNQNLSPWANKFASNATFTRMIQGSAISISNYDAFLSALNTTTLTGRTLGATGLTYCTSSAARVNLVLSTVSGGKGWTITDNGPIGTPTFGFGTSLGIDIGDAVPALPTISGNGMVGSWIPSAINNSVSGVYTFNGACGSTILNVKVLQPSDYFVTLWNMSIAGSGANQLSFDVGTSGVAQYYWETTPVASVSGFGTFTGSAINITGLPANETVLLKIAPQNFNYILIFNGADKLRLTDVKQWGSVTWSQMIAAFWGCSNLNISATDAPNLSMVNSMSAMFNNCTLLNSPSNINSWNVSNVKNLDALFGGCTNFNQNISSWNVSSVTSMVSMFQQATSFNQDISNWNVSNVTNFDRMFSSASSFNQNISNWDVSKATNFSSMLSSASNFNQNLASWIPKIRQNALLNTFLSYSNLSLVNYDLLLVALNNSSLVGMQLGGDNLKYCTASSERANLVLTTVSGGKGWTIFDAGQVSGAPTFAFANPLMICQGSPAFDLPTISGNGIIGTWTEPVANPTITGIYTFTGGCGSPYVLTVIPAFTTQIATQPFPISQTATGGNLATINVSAVGTNLTYRWNNPNAATTSFLGVNSTGSYQVTVTGVCGTVVSNIASVVAETTQTQDYFITLWNLSIAGSGVGNLTFGVQTDGVSSYQWETYPTATATGMGTFAGTTLSITGLPANEMIRLKMSPTNLQRVNIGGATDRVRFENIEQWGNTPWVSMQSAFSTANRFQISAIDVPNLVRCTSTRLMFNSCTVLTTPSNINNWDVSAITDMSSMFSFAPNFNQAIGNWNTANVTNMSSMFRGASKFNQAIGNWNTSKVIDMRFMFRDAIAFNQPIGSWNVVSVTNMSIMFQGAISFNQDVSAWDISNASNLSNMFSNATAFNQNLGAWGVKLRTGVSLISFLNNSGLNVPNYDALLTGFALSTITGRSLGATGLGYCTASAARAKLLNTTASGGNAWTITDAGVAVPKFSFGSVTGICQGSNFVLPTASGNGIDGSWSPSVVDNINGGTYTFTGTCGTATVLVSITGTPATILAQTSLVGICTGQTAMVNITATGSGTLAYLWNTGAISTGINTSIPGVYIASVTGSCNTAISTPITISGLAQTQIIDQTFATTVCGSGAIANMKITAAGDNLRYRWSNNPFEVNIGGQNLVSIPIGDSFFTATVSGTCGTVTSAIITATGFDYSTWVQTPSNTQICSTQTGMLMASATGINIQYLWSNGSTETMITPTVSGIYTVTASGYCEFGGDQDNKSAVFTINPLPVGTLSNRIDNPCTDVAFMDSLKINSSSELASIQWFKDGNSLPSNYQKEQVLWSEPSTISGFFPQYTVAHNNKVYFSENTPVLYTLNLATNQKEIALDLGNDYNISTMFKWGSDKLIVSKSFSGKLFVIDLNTNSVVQTYTGLSGDPVSINDNNELVLTQTVCCPSTASSVLDLIAGTVSGTTNIFNNFSPGAWKGDTTYFVQSNQLKKTSVRSNFTEGIDVSSLLSGGGSLNSLYNMPVVDGKIYVKIIEGSVRKLASIQLAPLAIEYITTLAGTNNALSFANGKGYLVDLSNSQLSITQINTKPPVYYPSTATGTYSALFTDLKGCAANSANIFEKKANPVLSITKPTAAVCANDNITLSATGANAITWNNGVQNGVSFAASQSGNYVVTGTGANGCAKVEMVVLTVNPVTNIVSVSNNQVVNTGAMVDLSISATGENVSYLWSNAATTASINNVGAGNYSVSASGVCGSLIRNILVQEIATVSVTGLMTNGNPSNASSPDQITLTGSGFVSGIGVTVNGIALTDVNVLSETLLTATLPAGLTAPFNISIQNPNQVASAGSVISPIDVTVPIATVSGMNTNGNPSNATSPVQITLTGSGFVSGVGVTVNGVALTDIVVVNGTTLTATLPAGLTAPFTIQYKTLTKWQPNQAM